MCSEGTPGRNFLNGTRFVADCARARCPAAEAAAAENAGLAAIESLCGVAYDGSVAVVTTVVGGVTTTVATTVVSTVPAEATPTFDCELCHS